MTPTRIAEVLAACDDETKIAVIAWTFKHLVEHAQDNGTLRHLVYERLGLPLAAYTPLLNAGGMTIVRHFELLGKREPAHETIRAPAEPTPVMTKAGVKMMLTGEMASFESNGEAVDAIYEAMLRAGKLDVAPPLADLEDILL